MESCPFCRIAAGEDEAHVIVGTDRSVAFLDENPAAPGHALVAPTTHTEALFEAEAATVADVFETVRRVVATMSRTLDPEGVSTFYTTGHLAGTVTHAHVHVVPRYDDDGIHVSLARHDLGADASGLADALRESLPETDELVDE